MYRVCFVTLPYTSKVEQHAILSILKNAAPTVKPSLISKSRTIEPFVEKVEYKHQSHLAQFELAHLLGHYTCECILWIRLFQ